MKKLVFIVPLLLLILIPNKAIALEEHEDYFNYALETYVEQIKQYKYHLFYKDSYKQYTLILSTDPLLNSTTFDRIDFNFSNYTGKYIVANKTNDYIADLSTITSSFNGITVYYSDYDVKNSLNKVSFAKNYTFVETPVDPSPSPKPEEPVDSVLYDIAHTLLGDLPEGFGFFYVVFEFCFSFFIIILFVAPFVLISRVLGGGR